MKKLFTSLLLGVAFMFGNDLIVESPKEINREWESKFLGIKYDVTTLDNHVLEMTEGLIDDYFDKAFIGRITEAIKNQPVGLGEYTEYWPDGTLKAKLPFKDGKAHGHIHGWHDNGVDAFKGYFTDGVKQGVHITFYKSDPKYNQKKTHLFIFNSKGLLDGEIRKYYKTGKLAIYIEYVNGKATGPLEIWDEKEKSLFEVLYKKGILQKKPPLPLGKRPEPRPAPYEKYADEIIKEFEKAAYKEFGVEAVGLGGQMPFDVVSVYVGFWVRKKGTVEEARELIVKLKEKFRVIINNHEKIRPYLREYPISIKNADVSVSFLRQDKNGVYYNKSVSFVSVGRGEKIYYSYDDPNENLLQPLFEESYEDAVKIVHAKDLQK
jgi:antitoxin component YwqK of YwqJK toxin-antitoxin module